MQTFKVSDKVQLDKLKDAAAMIAKGNKLTSEAKKMVESGKQVLADWLERERGVRLESLSIGDMVQIENVLLLDIGSMNKFDEKTFQAEHVSLHEEYKKIFAVRRFKPLV